MSAIIYVRSSGDDFTEEQLELLHKFSDQARVWAFLLLKEAGIPRSAEEWQQKRQEWLTTKEELKKVSPTYEEALSTALQTDYAAEKSPSQTALPPLSLPPDTPPEVTNEVLELAKKVKTLFSEVYPVKSEARFPGPYMTPDEMRDEIQMIQDDLEMEVGRAANAGVVDPEEIVQDSLVRAVRLYNPHKSEDIGTKAAAFRTYLYDVITTEIADQLKKQKKAPLSLDYPVGEEGLTLEEVIAEEAKKEGIDLENYVEPLREWAYKQVEATYGKFIPENAERMVDIYKRVFLEHEPYESIAAEYGLYKDFPREKDIPLMKSFGIDVSSLPAKLEGGMSVEVDRDRRKRLWTNFFANLRKRIADLKKVKPRTPEVTAELATQESKLQEVLAAFAEDRKPNATRVWNIVWGHPRAGHGETYIMKFLQTIPEVKELIGKVVRGKKKTALEQFLNSISKLRKEGELNYNLLRNKIEQRLTEENPQLFSVYTYLYESGFSNPDTARLMKLSPPRITGLKKKIISTLIDLPEISNILEGEDGSTSALRRSIYKEGDSVRVLSINEIGTILSVSANDVVRVALDNGNDVYTVKEDVQKHYTLIDSANNVLDHYFTKEVLTPQCYLSMIAGTLPKLVILELRPTSETKTTARLHINGNLVDLTEITEQYPDNLISILKGHLGTSALFETPFTSLFYEKNI